MKLALILLCSLVCSCTLIGPSGEELKGVPVDVVVEIAQATADNVALYDMNKDGVITEDEAVALGLALGQDVYQAILRFNSENPEVDG